MAAGYSPSTTNNTPLIPRVPPQRKLARGVPPISHQPQRNDPGLNVLRLHYYLRTAAPALQTTSSWESVPPERPIAAIALNVLKEWNAAARRTDPIAPSRSRGMST